MGKSSLSLEKLKNKILLNKDEKTGKFDFYKNSINSITSSLNNINDNFNRNILLERLNKKIKKSKNKKTKYNINIYLNDNKIQKDELLPVISSERKTAQNKNNINMNNEIKFNYYDINKSIRDLNDEDINKNENVLSKYIKDNYNNIKNSGYIGLVNIEHNRFIKKK